MPKRDPPRRPSGMPREREGAMSATHLWAKPCPFCGSGEVILLGPTCTESSPYDPAHRAFPVMHCNTCCAEVPGKDWDMFGKPAVEAWNRRVAAPACPEA